MAPSATHIVALGGIRMMLAFASMGLTGISILHLVVLMVVGPLCSFASSLTYLCTAGGCYGTQCYALASLRWLPDLGGLVSMGLNLDIIFSFSSLISHAWRGGLDTTQCFDTLSWPCAWLGCCSICLMLWSGVRDGV